MKEFDLNIEKVLENWTVAHAIREIIANALDEQILTGTDDIEIYRDKSGWWHIRDYGRGIQYQHLTQNENEEKQNHPHLIGKFGVGLKDALATFNRHGMDVIIDSKHGRITIGQSAKHGFSDITTLHAYIDDPVDKNFEGTDFCIVGCSRSDIEAAKDLFLEFAPIKYLEKTPYGDVLQKRNGISEIFINGIKVAEEENFLFSYNITALNSTLRKALNRERTNVGRTAYSDRIRAILRSAESEAVLSVFTDNLTQMSNGKQADELKWVDVQAHAVRHLSARKETVYVTPEEIQRSSGAVLEVIRNSGKQAVFVTEVVKQKIADTTDMNGKQISTIQSVVAQYNNSFQYDFVTYDVLTITEKAVFDLHRQLLRETHSKVKPEQIKIAQSLRPDFPTDSFGGVWDTEKELVIIRRDMLRNPSVFCGVLIHELTHADTGFDDIDRGFETALSRWIGYFAWKALSVDSAHK